MQGSESVRRRRETGCLWCTFPLQVFPARRETAASVPHQQGAFRRCKYGALQQIFWHVTSKDVHLAHPRESVFGIYLGNFIHRYARKQHVNPNFPHCHSRRIHVSVFILNEDSFQRSAVRQDAPLTESTDNPRCMRLMCSAQLPRRIDPDSTKKEYHLE